MSDSAVKRCGLGALIAAASEITGENRAAYYLAIRAMRPLYGTATLSPVPQKASSQDLAVPIEVETPAVSPVVSNKDATRRALASKNVSKPETG